MGQAGRPTDDSYVKLADVPQLVFELTGVHRGYKAVYSWVKHGRADQHGKLVKLNGKKRLGSWYTRRTWLNEFIEKVG